MRLSHRGRYSSQLLLISLFPLVGMGCDDELGAERMPTASVSGVVVESGRPVVGGWIEFIPVDGTVGNIRSGRIQPSGEFHVDRAALGENLVRLVNAPIQLPGGGRLFGAYSSPIRRVISAGRQGSLRIDLVEEAIRFQNPPTRSLDSAGRAQRSSP
jgi:hypothetical protein